MMLRGELSDWELKKTKKRQVYWNTLFGFKGHRSLVFCQWIVAHSTSHNSLPGLQIQMDFIAISQPLLSQSKSKSRLSTQCL